MKKALSLVLALALCLALAAPALALQTQTEVRVKSASELRSAISEGSNKRIVLAPGEYVFAFALSIWEIQNMTLVGEGDASILVTSVYDPVLELSSCETITLENLTLGHKLPEGETPHGGCVSGVICCDYHVKDLTVRNCDLFGCGVEGLNAYASVGIVFENSTIRDCSQQILTLEGQSVADFRECVFSGNCYVKENAAQYPALTVRNSTLRMSGCSFTDNRNTVFSREEEAEVSATDCVYTGNGWKTPGDSGNGSGLPSGGPDAPGASAGFSDVPEGAYFAEAVAWARSAGVTDGKSELVFGAQDALTRADAVTFLWRAMGFPAPKKAENRFADVAAGLYYTDAVLWAVEQGITDGTADDAFSPAAQVTYAQMLTFLLRAGGEAAVSDMDWEADPLNWGQYAGLLQALERTPEAAEVCSRADVVYFIWRYYENLSAAQAQS